MTGTNVIPSQDMHPGPPGTGAVAAHTPHQILGPYFPAIERPASTSDLAATQGQPGLAQGELIEVMGRVLGRNGKPVGGAKIVIWQANSFGRYRHPNDSNPAPLDENFVGFAEIVSDENGDYRFRSIKPGAYPAGLNRMRPPHIHFEVQGQFDRLITQMYFPGEPLNGNDALLQSANRPELLIARLAEPQNSSASRYAFDIVLMRG